MTHTQICSTINILHASRHWVHNASGDSNSNTPVTGCTLGKSWVNCITRRGGSGSRWAGVTGCLPPVVSQAVNDITNTSGRNTWCVCCSEKATHNVYQLATPRVRTTYRASLSWHTHHFDMLCCPIALGKVWSYFVQTSEVVFETSDLLLFGLQKLFCPWVFGGYLAWGLLFPRPRIPGSLAMASWEPESIAANAWVEKWWLKLWRAEV